MSIFLAELDAFVHVTLQVVKLILKQTMKHAGNVSHDSKHALESTRICAVMSLTLTLTVKLCTTSCIHTLQLYHYEWGSSKFQPWRWASNACHQHGSVSNTTAQAAELVLHMGIVLLGKALYPHIILSGPRSGFLVDQGRVCVCVHVISSGSRPVCFPGSWDGIWMNRSCDQRVINCVKSGE